MKGIKSEQGYKHATEAVGEKKRKKKKVKIHVHRSAASTDFHVNTGTKIKK